MTARPVFHPEIGQFFTELRDSKGWTQRQAEDIAERRKISALTRQVLWRLEKGKTKNLDPKVLRALADLYEMSYEELVSRWTAHKYGVVAIARKSDLPDHAGDQTSDFSRGKNTDVTAPATQARLQQLEQRIREQDDLIARLEAAARGLVSMFTTTSKNRKTSRGEHGGSRPGRAAS